AAQGQDRQGDPRPGARDRPDQAGGPEHRLHRVRDAHRRRHRPQHGHRSRLAELDDFTGECGGHVEAPPAEGSKEVNGRETGAEMATATKKLKAAEALFDREKSYSVEEALGILKKLPNAKFDETVDMSL